MHDSPFAINKSIGLYAGLLRLYPSRYRRRFKKEMIQVFEQVCREIYAEGEFLALMSLWLITIADLLKTVVEERSNEVINMRKDIFIQLGSVALMLGGIMFLLAGNLRGTLEAIWWWGSGLFFALGLGAIYARYGKELGSLARFGLLQGIVFSVISALRVSWLLPIASAMQASSRIVLASSEVPDSPLELLDIGVFAFCVASAMIGLVLFAVDVAVKKIGPEWKYIPLISAASGLVGFLIYLITQNQAVTGAFVLVMGIGITLTGLLLLIDKGGAKRKVAA